METHPTTFGAGSRKKGREGEGRGGRGMGKEELKSEAYYT